MKKYLILLCLFSSSSLFAQNPLWVKLLEDYGLGEGTNVAVDKNGNSYAFGCGSTGGACSTGAILSKYDGSGNVIWSKIICGINSTNIVSEGLVVDDNNNVYISGQFSQDSIVLDNDTVRKYNLDTINGPNYFIFKLDSFGNVVYHRNGGTCTNTTLAIDKEQNLIFAGSFYSSMISFGAFSLTNTFTSSAEAKSDAFLVKYDPDGDVVWCKSFGGSGDEIESVVTIDDSENIIIAGAFNSIDLTLAGSYLNSDSAWGIYLVKYDKSGDLKWATQAGVYSNSDYPMFTQIISGITTDIQGDIYTIGSFTKRFTIGSSIFNIGYDPIFSGIYNLDGYFAKFANNGNFVWAKKFGGADIDQGFEIAYDLNSNNIVLTGGIGSHRITIGGLVLTTEDYPSSDSVMYPNEDASFILECDLAGNAICGYVGDYGGDDVLALAIDNSGFIYTCGDAMAGERFPSGDSSIFVYGTESIFVSKMDRCPGTISKVEDVAKESKVNIFPNPADIEVTISYTGALDNDASVTLFDLAGRVVYNSLMNGRSLTISVSGLSKAMYFCKVIFNGQTITRKILVQ